MGHYLPGYHVEICSNLETLFDGWMVWAFGAVAYLSSIRSTLGAIIINFLRYLMTSVTNFDSLMYYKDIQWNKI